MENTTYSSFVNYLVKQDEVDPIIQDRSVQAPERSWTTTSSRRFLICAVSTLAYNFLEVLATQLTIPRYETDIRAGRYEAPFNPKPFLTMALVLGGSWIAIRYIYKVFSRMLSTNTPEPNPYGPRESLSMWPVIREMTNLSINAVFICFSCLPMVAQAAIGHNMDFMRAPSAALNIPPSYRVLLPFALQSLWNNAKDVLFDGERSYPKLNDTVPLDLMNASRWNSPPIQQAWQSARHQLCSQHQAVVVAALKTYRVTAAERTSILADNCQHFQAQAALLDAKGRALMTKTFITAGHYSGLNNFNITVEELSKED